MSFNDLQDLHAALIYGLKEFARQKNILNFVVGMSGGIDSSLVAYLCAKAVGSDRVMGINMPTKFNSGWTKDIAQTMADNLKIKYTIIPIEDLADKIREKIKGANFNNDFGDYTTVVDENLQARIRSADILAGIAAKYPRTVYTCNGNKTEILLGWFTLDGDGRGAICPIGDLYKTEIFELAKYINSAEKIFPESLFKLVPSAELSERQDVTKGLGDPIIFPYHDTLLRQLVEYRKNPADILKDSEMLNLGKKYFKSNAEWIADLERVWRLFHLAVFKQIQCPPVISVSKRPLGFDFRRSQLPPVLTQKYQSLKTSYS